MKTKTTPETVAPTVSELIDTLDMMRDEFLRIIACPGCNAEIEDLANRAQLNLIQRVPVIEQRDRAEVEVSRLRSALQDIAYLSDSGNASSHRVFGDIARVALTRISPK